METLPSAFLEKLFGLMPSLKEAIKCSHVCRSWREAYEKMRPETLCLYDQNYVPTNHRLFYSNDRMTKLNMLRLPNSIHSIPFFDSAAASIHFANLKRLVIFYPLEFATLSSESPGKFRLKDQLNAFKCLEYVEIDCDIVALEGCEINLPALKILSFRGCAFEGEPIVLNTPSLEAMQVLTGNADPANHVKIVNFRFVYPGQIKHLELTNYEMDFKFDFSKFVKLEFLIFSSVSSELYEKIELDSQLFANDFLVTLPNLKFLFFYHTFNGFVDYRRLMVEKRKLNLNHLRIINCSSQTFDYLNWPRYLEHKEQLNNWPGEVDAVFDELINYEVPLDLFSENYLRINELKVSKMDRLLIDFLRKTEIRFLNLEYSCRLRQSFLDEIADSGCSLYRLSFVVDSWNRFTDLFVLNRLNMLCFEVSFEQFNREAALAVLSNPACFRFEFNLCEGLWEDELKRSDSSSDVSSDEIRPNSSINHIIRRIKDEYHCEPCGWISCNDSKRCEGTMEVTLQHLENKWYTEGNMTPEEMSRPESCLRDK